FSVRRPPDSLLTYRSRHARRSRLEKQPTDPATAGRNICLFRGQDTRQGAAYAPSICSELELLEEGRFNSALKTRFGRLFPVSSCSRPVTALRFASSQTAGKPGELETINRSA